MIIQFSRANTAGKLETINPAGGRLNIDADFFTPRNP